MLICLYTPLAEIPPDQLEKLGKAFTEPAGENRFLPPTWTFVTMGALLVFTILALWLWDRYKKTRHRTAPHRVFKKIASQLGLGPGDRGFLTRIARQQRLPSPLTLLLSTATLDHHARQYAAQASGFRQSQILKRASSLQARLSQA